MQLTHTLLPSVLANLHPDLLVPLLKHLNIYKMDLQKTYVLKQSSQHYRLTDALTNIQPTALVAQTQPQVSAFYLQKEANLKAD